MTNKENAKEHMDEYLTHILESLFNKKPNLDNLIFNISINECDCSETHFIIQTKIKYSFIGDISDVNVKKVETCTDGEFEKFPRAELEYAKEEIDLKELIDLIYD